MYRLGRTVSGRDTDPLVVSRFVCAWQAALCFDEHDVNGSNSLSVEEFWSCVKTLQRRDCIDSQVVDLDPAAVEILQQRKGKIKQF